jgi:hypothetical protein
MTNTLRSYLFIFFSLFSVATQAQSDQKTAQKADSLLKIAEGKHLSKTDSSLLKLDSVSNSVIDFKVPRSNKLDSLNPTNKLADKSNQVNQKVRNMTSVDSLFLRNPDLRKIDSMKIAFQAKSKEIKNKAGRKQKKIKHSLDSLEGSYQKKVNAMSAKFMEKNKDFLNGHEKEIAGKMNVNAPAVSKQFPDVNLGGAIPGGSSKGLPNAKVPGNNSSLPNSSLNLSQLNIAEVKDVQKEAAEIKKIKTRETQEVNKLKQEKAAYQKQLKQYKKDSLANGKQAEKWTEDQIQGRKEVKALKDKQLEMDKQNQLRQQYLDKVAQYQNPKKVEALAEQDLAKVANNDLLKNEKAVQSAQMEMMKAKKKYGEFQSMKKLPMRALNPMSQLSLRERLYPGIFFQATNSKFFSLDLAPQIHYKVTTRFDVGLGFVYRINYDFKKSTLVQNNALYGFKVFSNFKIYKTFYFRAEGERIFKEEPTSTSDLVYQRWTNTLLGGIGKEFLISNKVQANTLVLYNALENFDNPYASKVLFRIGFSFSLKKNQRKEFMRSLHSSK